jgi:hypothetical protein
MIILFNTASLGDSDTIDSATLEFVATAKGDALSPAGSLRMVTSTPTSDTGLVAADYAQLGTVGQAPDMTIASVDVGGVNYNVMTLNATGRGNVSKAGVSKFGVRTISDADNAEPTWASDANQYASIATAEESLAGDKRPKLVVTHTAPPSTFVPKLLVF